MRINYIARHGGHGNDDEGAIAYALRGLGHTVNTFDEGFARDARGFPCDLVLFHKWDAADAARELAWWEGRAVRAFWYFDLVDWPADPTLARRCLQRRDWMTRVLPSVELGFCTDGDWVTSEWTRPDGTAGTHPKLRWLTQGADGRLAGRHAGKEVAPAGRILFTGSARNCGTERERFHDELVRRYPGRVTHHANGVYGKKLRREVALHDVVVCPWAPVTDRYWSNRVYVAAGFGGFVLHPQSSGLGDQYGDHEVPRYRSEKELFEILDGFTGEGPLRKFAEGYRERALARTLKNNLYRHRCEQLTKEVSARA